jgi:hypothetical protein
MMVRMRDLPPWNTIVASIIVLRRGERRFSSRMSKA